MHRIALEPRPNWQQKVEEYGLHFHTQDGIVYWDESAAYQLSRHEVDQLELATNRLHEMCIELVGEIIDGRQFDLFFIPPAYHDMIVQSWEKEEPSIYGRFDLAYDGTGSPRLLEYNADTPTALVEASVIQWFWLKEVDERGDQFNSIHEHLIDAWKALHVDHPEPLHFAAVAGNVEDYVTVEYLRDTAIQAGFATDYLDIEQIGWDHQRRVFIDRQGRTMRRLFKLYPWEWLVHDEFGQHIPRATLHWIEPAWKMLLSCKSILPLLYERYPDCPYLLPASFDELQGDFVRKPILAREGSNVQLVLNGHVEQETEGPYPGPYVYQQFVPLRAFDDCYPIIGSWVVGGESCGIGIREDSSRITSNRSRFVPHQMVD